MMASPVLSKRSALGSLSKVFPLYLSDLALSQAPREIPSFNTLRTEYLFF
jgi:hypothetical protein